MCYNYTQHLSVKDLEKEYKRKMLDDAQYQQHYNANGFNFPKMPIITSENKDVIELGEWGFMPDYISDPKDTKAKKIRSGSLNARSETIFELSTFKKYAGVNHCLITTTGFLEPHHNPDGSVTYYFISLKSRKAFSLGGLWKIWKDRQTGIVSKNFSMITVPANPLLARIHNKKPRMPFILPEQEENLWLSGGLSRPDIESLMQPYAQEDLQAWPVSNLINTRGVNTDVEEAIRKSEPTRADLILENNKVLGLIDDSAAPTLTLF